MKAQASLEQLVVFATALAFVAVAFYIASNYSSDNARVAQAQNAVERLAAAADRVYALGPSSREYVTVYLPEDIRVANVTPKSVLLTVGTSAGTTDVYSASRPDLIGSVPSSPGIHRILVEYLVSGKVRIGEGGITCTPAFISRSFNSGDTGSDSVEIYNGAEFNVTGITASLSGATSLVSAGSPPSSLAPGANGTLGITYDIPSSQRSGIYGATVVAESANGGSCSTQITLHVNGASSCSSLCASQGYLNGTCRASSSACSMNGEDYHAENSEGCGTDALSPECCCWPTSDLLGPVVSSSSHTPLNATANSTITIYAVCNDTATGGSFIKGADVQVDGGNWTPMSASDGAFSDSVVENATSLIGQLSPGQHIAALRCTDTADNTGPTAYHFINVSMGDILGPIITMMNHSDAFPTTLANISEMGEATDAYTGNANVSSCNVRVDLGDWHAAAATDGFFDSPTEGFTYNIGQLTTGTHYIYAYCTDSLGNVGGTYNDTISVSSADAMIVIDHSGSMGSNVTNAADNTQVSTGSATFALVKSVLVSAKNGDSAIVSTTLWAGKSGCTVSYEARVGSTVIAFGSRASTTAGTLNVNASVAAFSAPFYVDLYLEKTYSSSCTVYNSNFNVQQGPTKMSASQGAAKAFVDLLASSTQAGLVSYSDSATTNRQLTLMSTAANKNLLKNAIDSVVSSGNTCIEYGINNAVNELISSRGRYPNSVRVIVLLTDGQDTVSGCDSIAGATYARNNNAKIYTIGFGNDVDDTELTNIALLTYGKYYYAPDVATLQCIYQHIGLPNPC